MKTLVHRVEAGRLLGQRLAALSWSNPLVLALPRGGVPVAAEVACALHAPPDLLMVRKIARRVSANWPWPWWSMAVIPRSWSTRRPCA